MLNIQVYYATASLPINETIAMITRIINASGNNPHITIAIRATGRRITENTTLVIPQAALNANPTMLPTTDNNSIINISVSISITTFL
ncbi:MAG: hypothetical protein IKQ71_07210 [Lachnospiraceae bacterium]|nr:hypothetical protein [Lachnospiraceae bacterium]